MYKQKQVKTTAENTFVKSLLALNLANLTQCDIFCQSGLIIKAEH